MAHDSAVPSAFAALDVAFGLWPNPVEAQPRRYNDVTARRQTAANFSALFRWRRSAEMPLRANLNCPKLISFIFPIRLNLT